MTLANALIHDAHNQQSKAHWNEAKALIAGLLLHISLSLSLSLHARRPWPVLRDVACMADRPWQPDPLHLAARVVNAAGGIAFDRSLWTSRWSPEASTGHFAIAAALTAAFLLWMKDRSATALSRYRISVPVLCDSLESAAAARDCRPTTLRVHLRHIFAKTGVSRQADLVGLLARMGRG